MRSDQSLAAAERTNRTTTMPNTKDPCRVLLPCSYNGAAAWHSSERKFDVLVDCILSFFLSLPPSLLPSLLAVSDFSSFMLNFYESCFGILDPARIPVDSSALPLTPTPVSRSLCDTLRNIHSRPVFLCNTPLAAGPRPYDLAGHVRT